MISGISGSSSMWNQMNVRSMRPSKEEMFNRMDANADGGIDPTEMQTVLDKMASPSGQAGDVDELFAQYDSDGDGQLCQEETDSAMESLRETAGAYGGMPPPPDFSRLFDDTDANADGSIDESELQTLVDKINSGSGQTIDAQELLGEFDADGDGRLNEDEANAAMEPLGGPPQQARGMKGPARGEPPPLPDFGRMVQDADTDSDGSIAKTEMQTVLDELTERSGAAVSVDDLFSEYDSDSDGQLTETEAVNALASFFESLKPDSAAMKKLYYESQSYRPIDVMA